MSRVVLIVVYGVSALLEIGGLVAIFQPRPVDRHDGTIVWVEHRIGARLIGVGIVIGLAVNIASLYVLN
jgi:hypothetical protein